MSNTRYELFIPGPIEMADDVLSEMAEPMMPHFGTDWADIYEETTALTKQIFQTEGEVYIIPGSGSAALDMGIGNLVYGDKRVLVLSNGFFGDRLGEIAKGFTPNVDIVDFGFANPFSLSQVEERLHENTYDALLAVHVETSIGIVNPIQDIAAMTRDSNVVLFVDGVSSIGVEAMRMDDWGVDVCITASQKGLESPPGLGIIAFNKKAWSMMETVNRPDWYLNLKVWKRYEPFWGPSHPQLVTHAVPVVKAMTVALRNMLRNGYDAHIQSYLEITDFFRAEIENLGYPLFIPEGFAHGVTAITVPDGKAFELAAYFKDKYHILVGGGLGPSKGKVIRIGHMGVVADKVKLQRIIHILTEAKEVLGI